MALTSNTTERAGYSAAVEPGRHAPRETVSERLRRWALGVAWSLKPPRLWGVPATLWMVALHYFGLRSADEGLPDPENALATPDGLAGICTDLNPETLMAAYRAGLFPFCHVGPVKWWAPSLRMVLRPEDCHIEKNVRRMLRNRHFHVTFDRAFEAVIRGCAEPRPGRFRLTWITPRIIDAYCALHEAGHAHSVEVWDAAGNLAGGVYGISAGRVFFTESQFSRERDASKVGFATLNCHLQAWKYALNDGKFYTDHLAQAGFRLMPRRAFNRILADQCNQPGRDAPWRVDESLDVGNWRPDTGFVPRIA